MFQKREKYMLFRYLGLVCVIALGVLSTLGSGGGGGGGGTAPNIGNLLYWPTGAFLNDGNGSTIVNGNIWFSDPDGDIASYVLTITDSSNNVVATLSDPIPGLDGIADGVLFISLLVNTTIVGDYTVSVYLIDSENNASNTLTGLFPVVGPTQVSSNLPDTGVDKCYNHYDIINCPISESDAFYGQDFHYSSNPMSFTNNGDGTITDNVTSLMWQATPDGFAYNWYEATGTYDEDSNPSTIDTCGVSTLAGHEDWRLPVRRELHSLVDYGTINPAIDITYFSNTGINDYWSNTERNITEAYYQAFADGSVSSADKTFDKNVHCVRGTTWGNSIFVVNGNGTVTDTDSGLMWQKTAQGPGYDWQEKLNICTELELAGYSDWRLPDIKELATTVDAGAYLDMPTDASLFSSSTTKVDEYDSEWVMMFSPGNPAYVNGQIIGGWAGGSSKTIGTWYNRCVR